MTQGFLLGLGIFGGLIVGGLLVSIGGLILSNIVEIAKVVGIFVGIAVVSYLGFAGCAVTFVDYLNEFPFFVERVLPRLERAGLRHAADALH